MASQGIRVFALAFMLTIAGSFGGHAEKVHGFVEDDRGQFVDIWLNNNGTLTFKASNGRRGVPMNIILTLEFYSGDRKVAVKSYNVWCPAPPDETWAIGVKGKEKWFEGEPGPGVAGITKITGSSHKVK